LAWRPSLGDKSGKLVGQGEDFLCKQNSRLGWWSDQNKCFVFIYYTTHNKNCGSSLCKQCRNLIYSNIFIFEFLNKLNEKRRKAALFNKYCKWHWKKYFETPSGKELVKLLKFTVVFKILLLLTSLDNKINFEYGSTPGSG
jgi:hypothetical protein